MVTNGPQGWIPIEGRDDHQMSQTHEFWEKTPTVSDACTHVTGAPQRVIVGAIEQEHLGESQPYVWQQTGSCVGSAASPAYRIAMFGDRLLRGDRERVVMPFPFSTYGVGRRLGGLHGQGSGSFGATQAEAAERFGIIERTSPLVPQGTTQGKWIRWTKQQELQWSNVDSWPGDRAKLEEEHYDHRMGDVSIATSTDELVELIVQLYGVTIASTFGSRTMRVKHDVLLAEWDATWHHQMLVTGFWYHPQLGLIFLVQNNWGPGSHPSCPTASQFGLEGCFWVLEGVMARIIRGRETIGHSNTSGFPMRDIWGSVGL